jgi:hypothetical protein
MIKAPPPSPPAIYYNGARVAVQPGCRFTLSPSGMATFKCANGGVIRITPKKKPR